MNSRAEDKEHLYRMVGLSDKAHAISALGPYSGNARMLSVRINALLGQYQLAGVNKSLVWNELTSLFVFPEEED